jgi:acyl-CoA synthetase (NDP forming)
MTIMHPALMDDPRGVDILAADGAVLTVRSVRPEDRTALLRLHGESSGQVTVRLCVVPTDVTGVAEIDRLCPETSDRLAVVAVDGSRIAGVAFCTRPNRSSHTGAVSMLIAEPDRGRGIGALLLEQLADRAGRTGMTRLVGDALSWDGAVMRQLSATQRHSGEQPDHDDTETLRRAVDARDRPANGSLPQMLLEPRTVAVTGAMQRRGGAGFEVVRAIRDYGFTGRLYPVNGSGRPVCGLPAYRAVTDLPGPVELLIVAGGPDMIPQALSEAGKHGIRTVILADGGSIGPEIRRIAQENGIRLLGPGSLGTINTDPRVRLNATLSPARPPAGRLAMAAHSGSVGIGMLEHSVRNGCGLSSFVSLGDTADLAYDDLLRHWHSDPGTGVVALHLDGLGAGSRFARTARALARRKPVLAIRSGRSTADDLFAQAGIILAADLDEMIDAARLLADQPLPGGTRVGVVGNASGLGPLVAETAGHLGLTVPRLSPALRDLLPHGMDNPVELGPGATPAQIAAVADVVAGSGEIDILLLPIVGTRANVPAAILTALSTVMDRHAGLTNTVVLTGSADDIHRIGVTHTPVYRQLGRALRALAHAYRYARWRAQPLGRGAHPGGIDAVRARRLIAQASAGPRGWTSRALAVDILAVYGITVLPGCRAGSGVSAVAAAERLGYPVTIRPATDAPGRRGNGRRGLTTAAAVRETFDAVIGSDRSGAGVLVQHQLAASMELSAGCRRIPGFGPIVEAATEQHSDDVVRRIVPLTDLDAARMRHELLPPGRGVRRRHRPPVNTVAVEDIMLRLSALADDQPEIAELEISPLLAGPNGVVATDVRLRLRTGATHRTPAPEADA